MSNYPSFEEFYDFKNDEIEEKLERINEEFLEEMLPLTRIVYDFLNRYDRLTYHELLEYKNYLLEVLYYCDVYFVEIRQIFEEIANEENYGEMTRVIMADAYPKARLYKRYERYLQRAQTHLRMLRDIV